MPFQKLQSNATHLFVSYTADHPDGRCVILVVGFGTDSFALNPRQVGLLSMSIPTLNEPSTVFEAYGRADRSGADRHNIGLTRRRLTALQERLVSLGAPRDKVFNPNCKALGERFEAFKGIRDGERSQGGRTVWAFFWPSDAAFREGPDGLGLRSLTDFGRSFVPVF
jgi:hypothetical protein